jgi:hypothetical protein
MGADLISIIDFNGYEPIDYYGGNAGRKYGICYDGAVWIIKYPQSTKGFAGKHLLSYTTSPLSEYIGSHVYESLGIPVHKTLLGFSLDKIVVACKDFRAKGDTLIEFHDLKNAIESSDGSSGSGTDLQSALETIETNKLLQSVVGVTERFWDMFIVDTLINNNDRNNGNWGILQHADGSADIAPVYDNGNSLFGKRTPSLMQERLESENLMMEDAVRVNVSIYTITGQNGEPEHIHPFDYLKTTENPDCLSALKRISERCDQNKIEEIIDSIPETFNNITVCPAGMKEFYKELLNRKNEELQLIIKERDL